MDNSGSQDAAAAFPDDEPDEPEDPEELVEPDELDEPEDDDEDVVEAGLSDLPPSLDFDSLDLASALVVAAFLPSALLSLR